MSQKPLHKTEIKTLRSIGHYLKPVVMMGASGITDTLVAEITRALNDHELIKIKITGEDRDERKQALTDLLDRTNSVLVQSIGKTALLYKKNTNPNPRLSNIIRYSV